MKVAVNLQEENWEDDGGAHDPFILDLDLLRQREPAIADRIENAVRNDLSSVMLGKVDPNIFDDCTAEPPCMVDGVLPLWFSYG